MDYLIQHNIIKQSKETNGTYGDSLVVTGKYGSGRGKQRFTTIATYNYLLRLKLTERLKKFFSPEQLREILKLDTSEQYHIIKELETKNIDLMCIKDNQRYLFSGISNDDDVSERVS